VFRFPGELAVQIAVQTVESWFVENNEKSVKKVVFNVFGDKDLELYRNILN